MTSLQELDLSGNLFFGELPSCIGDLNSLGVLHVSEFCGEISFS
jgi:hypothetical protein